MMDPALLIGLQCGGLYDYNEVFLLTFGEYHTKEWTHCICFGVCWYPLCGCQVLLHCQLVDG